MLGEAKIHYYFFHVTQRHQALRSEVSRGLKLDARPSDARLAALYHNAAHHAEIIKRQYGLSDNISPMNMSCHHLIIIADGRHACCGAEM